MAYGKSYKLLAKVSSTTDGVQWQTVKTPYDTKDFRNFVNRSSQVEFSRRYETSSSFANRPYYYNISNVGSNFIESTYSDSGDREDSKGEHRFYFYYETSKITREEIQAAVNAVKTISVVSAEGKNYFTGVPKSRGLGSGNQTYSMYVYFSWNYREGSCPQGSSADQ